MPVSDHVLGSHLDLEGVAGDARAEANQQFLAAIDNDADLSSHDRLERFGDLARIPGLRLAVACEGEDLGRYLVIAHAGALRTVMLADSRSHDRVEPPAGAIRPEVRVAGDLAAVTQRLEQAGAIDPVYDVGDSVIELPFHWSSRDELMGALAEVAGQLSLPLACLVEVDGRRLELRVEGKRVSCAPLYLVAPDGGPGFGDAFFELARLSPPSDADRFDLPIRAARVQATIAAPPMRDPSRPYTTGTVEQRRASIAAATAAKTRDFGRLIAALQDPANADPRYDQVRRDLYRYLASHDNREVAGLFLWALQEETEALIETVTYLAWRQTALRDALPDLAEAAEARGDRKLAFRMRAALDEAGS